MASYYDKQIIDLVAASDRPLRHSEIAHFLAPADNRAWSRIGGRLTHLYRAGLLSREKTDGRYFHYGPGDGTVSPPTYAELRAEFDRVMAGSAALLAAAHTYVARLDADVDDAAMDAAERDLRAAIKALE